MQHADARGGRSSSSRATSSTAGGTGASACSWLASTLANQMFGVAIHRAREPARRQALLVLAVAANLAVLGYFKYYDFFVDVVVQNVLGGRRHRTSRRRARGHAADRHLVLHVPGAELRDRHLPRRPRAGGAARLRASTSRSSRTSSPGRSCAPREFLPQLGQPRATRGASTRAAPSADRRRPVQEGGDRRLPRRRDRRRRVRRAGPHCVARGAGRRLRLRGPDLLRLLGYTDIADRPRAAARLPLPAELRRARTRAELAAGLLAALAHDPVALAARLPVHPARRQPRARARDVPQPDAHDAARRPVARRRLDVRRLGRHPRRRARRRALVGRAGVRRAGCRTPPSTWLRRNGAVGWSRSRSSASAWVFFRADSFATAADIFATASSTPGASRPAPSRSASCWRSSWGSVRSTCRPGYP